jgi:hypothetical protein
MPHQTIHISAAEDLTEYFPASPTESHASTEALYIPAPGTPYQTTSPTGTLPLVEDAAPTNAARVLAVDLAIGTAQPAIPLSPRAISTIIEGQAHALMAPVLLRMVRGLVLTAKRTKDRMEAVRITAEEQAMELEQSKDQRNILALGARNLQLERNAQAESLCLADLTIRCLASQPPRTDLPTGLQSEAPDRFIENNRQLHYFSIPLQGSSNDCCIAPYIQLLDGPVVRYPFALRAERNGTNASDVRYPDAADPLYLLYLWTLGRRFLHSHLSPAYPVIPSWTHVMTFLQPRFVVIGTWHVYKPSYISPQSLVK